MDHDPQYIMDMLRSSPEELALLKQNNPTLAEAMDKGIEEFTKWVEGIL